MTAKRLISPFEATYFGTDTSIGSVPTAGMPLFFGSTVYGSLDVAVIQRVLDELAAAHPLLRSRVVDGWFVRDDEFRPRLDIVEGGDDDYLALINTPQEWTAGLFRAVLLREEERQQLVLVVHHGISDGRSAFALLNQFWARYTSYVTDSVVAQLDSRDELPLPMDQRLADVVSEVEADAWLTDFRTAAMNATEAPRALMRDGAVGDARRFALERIELSVEHTAEVVKTARAQGVSVNSVISGATLAAVRTRIAEAGPLPLMLGFAADVRGECVPPEPVETMANFASGAGVFAMVDGDMSPLDVAHQVEAGMRAIIANRDAARFPLAIQRVKDAPTLAMLSTSPSFALSNIGRVQPHSLPDDVAFLRTDIYAMGPQMPPKLTAFTIANRLTLQLEYDTALYSRDQMGKLRRTLTELLSALAQ
ncbi:phthiocerol/phthiodiolone dimycocerosyl transferase family protein [Nocardia camponoti]|nr:hypothetical protein [Nocardia camponoti]